MKVCYMEDQANKADAQSIGITCISLIERLVTGALSWWNNAPLLSFPRPLRLIYSLLYNMCH